MKTDQELLDSFIVDYGVYINTSIDKGQWLTENSESSHSTPPEFSDIPNDCLLVCMVDNGPFTAAAAGVCIDKQEYSAFTYNKDHRPKVWFIVTKVKLVGVCPEILED